MVSPLFFVAWFVIGFIAYASAYEQTQIIRVFFGFIVGLALTLMGALIYCSMNC